MIDSDENVIQKNIIKLLALKLKFCNELLDITKKQTLWIEQEQLKRLENTINSKERRINKIRDLDQKIQKIYANNKGKDCFSEREIEECKQNINAMIEEINNTEKSNVLLMEAATNGYKRKTIETQTKIKINNAYTQKKDTQKSGYFIDKRK